MFSQSLFITSLLIYPLKSTPKKHTTYRQQLLLNSLCITYFFHVGMSGTERFTYLAATACVTLFSYLCRRLWFPSSFLGAHQRMCVEVRRTWNSYLGGGGMGSLTSLCPTEGYKLQYGKWSYNQLLIKPKSLQDVYYQVKWARNR